MKMRIDFCGIPPNWTMVQTDRLISIYSRSSLHNQAHRELKQYHKGHMYEMMKG